MKTLAVRVPDRVAADIEAESRKRKVSKSDIVRYRLISAKSEHSTSLEREDGRAVGGATYERPLVSRNSDDRANVQPFRTRARLQTRTFNGAARLPTLWQPSPALRRPCRFRAMRVSARARVAA